MAAQREAADRGAAVRGDGQAERCFAIGSTDARGRSFMPASRSGKRGRSRANCAGTSMGRSRPSRQRLVRPLRCGHCWPTPRRGRDGARGRRWRLRVVGRRGRTRYSSSRRRRSGFTSASPGGCRVSGWRTNCSTACVCGATGAEVTLEETVHGGTVVRWRSTYDRAGPLTALVLRLAVRDACRRLAKAASP
jgi:hypothetical protein